LARPILATFLENPLNLVRVDAWLLVQEPRIRMGPVVKKEAIKVRLVRPGLLELEWPRG
jgi:hypothetical protein